MGTRLSKNLVVWGSNHMAWSNPPPPPTDFMELQNPLYDDPELWAWNSLISWLQSFEIVKGPVGPLAHAQKTASALISGAVKPFFFSNGNYDFSVFFLI